MFSEAILSQIVKCQDCVLKGSPFTKQSQILMTQGKKPFGNIVGKGENAGNQHFLLFPRFLLYQGQIQPLEQTLISFLQML